MPKLFLSDDPFAAASENCRHCRKPSFALFILFIPALGFTGLLYGTQTKCSRTLCRSFQSGPTMERAGHEAHRAVQLREIETARANVLYWRRRSREDGAHRAAALAKLSQWKRGYQQRQELFARMYPPH